MTYTSDWQNDVFVSYAQVDDQPLSGGSDGWVGSLVEDLKVLLGQHLGRIDALTVWRDVQLPGHAPLTSEILARVRSSATLLIVLSEGYLASEWCRREYREFLALAGRDTRRLFVVERTPIERHRRPHGLVDLLGYPFWVRDRRDDLARTLGVPTPTPDEREYYHRLGRLALELASELQRLKAMTQQHVGLR